MVFLTVRSYRAYDYNNCSWQTTPNNGYQITAEDIRCVLDFYVRHNFYYPPPGYKWSRRMSWDHYRVFPTPYGPQPFFILEIDKEMYPGNFPPEFREWRLEAPGVVLAAAGMIAPSILCLRRIGQLRRRKRGLCVCCGYDLRATADRCPECGTTAPTKESFQAEPFPKKV
jgi:hypothetical protein